jgi:hypothetical protein
LRDQGKPANLLGTNRLLRLCRERRGEESKTRGNEGPSVHYSMI